MIRLCCTAAALLFLAGCSTEPFDLAPVKGRVTLNGEPLADAAVLFQPLVPEGGNGLEVGPESGAHTNADGTFELRTFAPERIGAVVGRHRVVVSLPKEEGQSGGALTEEGTTPDGVYNTVKYTIPLRYRDGSALSYEVPPEGLTDLHIELTSP